MQTSVKTYLEKASRFPLETQVTRGNGETPGLDDAFKLSIDAIQAMNEAGNTLRFIGNGGSAGIASHMAVDFSKRGKIRATALNDASMLTCLGNDLGYEEVFSHQLGLHARDGDMLIAISSSGQSENITRAVDVALEKGVTVHTFSGFSPDNPLRQKGDINYYIDSMEYGFVELSHMALLSAMIDLLLGWREDRPLGI